MKSNKRGVSELISYVMLISIALVLGLLVYGWASSYIPKETLQCPDGVSLTISQYEYNCTSGILALGLSNRGRFSVDGYFVKASNTSASDLPTIDLFKFFDENASHGEDTAYSEAGVILVGASEPWNPGQAQREHVFNVASLGQVRSIEILPFRDEVVENVQRVVACSEARVQQPILCTGGSYVLLATCGNDVGDFGEICDGSDLNNQTCISQGFEGGTLSCAASCQSFDTSRCTSSALCGNGVINANETCDGPNLAGQSCLSLGFTDGTLSCSAGCGAFITTQCYTLGNGIIEGAEQCDDNNTVSSDGCSSTGQIEFGWACSGQPSVCAKQTLTLFYDPFVGGTSPYASGDWNWTCAGNCQSPGSGDVFISNIGTLCNDPQNSSACGSYYLATKDSVAAVLTIDTLDRQNIELTYYRRASSTSPSGNLKVDYNIGSGSWISLENSGLSTSWGKKTYNLSQATSNAVNNQASIQLRFWRSNSQFNNDAFAAWDSVKITGQVV